MPAVCREKEIGKNTEVLIPDIPIIANPISSGMGEASTKAPVRMVSERKRRARKKADNLAAPVWDITYRISLAMLSRTKRKII